MTILLICIFFCVFGVFIRHGRTEAGKKPFINDLIKGLKKTPFDPKKFSHMDKCQICFEDYQVADNVTTLDCNRTHYFHTECISKWFE